MITATFPCICQQNNSTLPHQIQNIKFVRDKNSIIKCSAQFVAVPLSGKSVYWTRWNFASQNICPQPKKPHKTKVIEQTTIKPQRITPWANTYANVMTFTIRLDTSQNAQQEMHKIFEISLE